MMQYEKTPKPFTCSQLVTNDAIYHGLLTEGMVTTKTGEVILEGDFHFRTRKKCSQVQLLVNI